MLPALKAMGILVQRNIYQVDSIDKNGVPKGSRTPVAGVRGQRPRPLDDGDIGQADLI